MNCIIIEDDKLTRMLIEEYIGRTEGLVKIESFESDIDAINLLKEDDQKIELIFLDIEMPEMDGIEFLKSLKKMPQVIITSSRDKYALQAFDFNVTDYLLKPITYSRFIQAVERAQNRKRTETKDTEKSREIFIKKGSTLIRMKYEDIVWVEALENYIILNTLNDKVTIHFTMKAIEKKLPSDIFIRVHRSYIVNKSRIKVIKDNSVELDFKDSNKSIPIGKSYKNQLISDINLIVK